MAGRIPKTFIDDLLARADVVEVIGRRLTLKRAGKEYKACCPFHHEKTPSFYINPAKGFYHCFGCGAHGDALRFLMDYEHLDFVAAIEVLAQEMGLSVPYERQTPEQQQRERVQRQKQLTAYEVLARVADWYAQNLREHPERERAVAYLQGRGISGQMAKAFRLGLAPAAKDALQRAMPDVTPAQWQALGLVSARDDGVLVDKFRQRIMFPIHDPRGRVVGFGGRLMAPSEHAPKYLNSPETDYFHKGRLLYGFHEMLRRERQLTQVLVVEGYLDVIALVQAGLGQVVATLGTATTPEHLQLLYKHTQDVVFTFDGDKAGRKAAWKALAVVLPQLQGVLSARFCFLPEGEDPDSLVRRIGAEAFMQQMAEQALSPGQWLVRGLSEQMGLDWQTSDDQRRLLAAAREWVSLCADKAVQYSLVQAMAQASGLAEIPVEKQLGIRTGLAAFQPMGRGRYRTSPATAAESVPLRQPSLRVRLQTLCQLWPQLQADWPEQDEALLRRYGDKALLSWLDRLKQGAVQPTQAEQGPLSHEQAVQEWRDGWQQLVCQSVAQAREGLLKSYSGGAMTPEGLQQVRALGELLRARCGRGRGG